MYTYSKEIILFLVVVFFSLNMGASGIAPSFAATYGAKLISRKWSIILFGLFVVLGALLLGERVAKTLSSGLLAQAYFTFDVVLAILIGAAISLFVANFFKIPQSTSWVTVFAIAGAALYFQNLNMAMLARMVLLWLLLPLLSFGITFLLFKVIYPPRSANLWFYEKAHLWKKKIILLAIISSCYVAFAIGSNNVANAVGPLVGANLISIFLGILLIAPLFGVGGWVAGGRTMQTIGKEIVPLGIITSTLVAMVTASLLIVASAWGVPQSLVQLNAFSIMAIRSIKHEHVLAIKQAAVRKTFIVWLIAPVVSLLLTYVLLKAFA